MMKDRKSPIVVDPSRIQQEYLKDLLRYRELFYFFTWRDLVVRYKQTFLGILWGLVRPLINMAVFAFIFGRVANLASDHINYPLFVLAGLLPWQLFASCLVDTSMTFINNSQIISKVYFPRIILPVTQIIVNFIDFLISLTLLMGLLLMFSSVNVWTLLGLQLFIFLTLLFCLGVSLWLSAISVRYRDLRFIIPFIVQFGMFVSPVGYSSFLITDSWRWLYFLNPMAGIIEGFRWCCFGVYHADLPLAVLLSSCVSLGLLVTGFRFFRKMERLIADII